MKSLKISIWILGVIIAVIAIIFFSFRGCDLYKAYKASKHSVLMNKNFIEKILLDSDARFAVHINLKQANKPIKKVKAFFDTYAFGSIDSLNVAEYGTYVSTLPDFCSDIAGGHLDPRVFTYSFDMERLNFLNIPTKVAKNIRELRCYYANSEAIVNIGKMVLTKAIWFFNSDSATLTISDDINKLNFDRKAYKTITNGFEHNNTFVNVAIENGTPALISMDLGLGWELSLEKGTYDLWIKKLNREPETWFGYTIKTGGINNSPIDTCYVIRDISIVVDGFKIEHVTALYHPKINNNAVGAPLMKKFNFILDYINGQGYMNRNSNNKTSNFYYQLFQKDFLIENRNNQIIVSVLKQNGIAEKAGLKFEDKILDYNKINIDYTKPASICEHYHALENLIKANKTLHLSVQRGNKIVEITL